MRSKEVIRRSVRELHGALPCRVLGCEALRAGAIVQARGAECFPRALRGWRGPALVAAGDASALTVGFGAVLKAQQVLLSMYEQAAFGDAMVIRDNVLSYARGLFQYLAEPAGPESFDRYVAALESVRPTGKQGVMKWPVLTLFPFLADPREHMFLKPVLTQKAAEIIGIDIAYDALLNWKTYDRVRKLAGVVEGELAKRGLIPADRIRDAVVHLRLRRVPVIAQRHRRHLDADRSGAFRCEEVDACRS